MSSMVPGGAILALLLVPAAASAQNAPPAYLWTGCYVGGHLGGLVIRDQRPSSFSVFEDRYSSSGVTVGAQAGCDYQFASRWVIGLDGRATWENPTHSRELTWAPSYVQTLNEHYTHDRELLGSVTARLGYTFVDRWLVYVRGGAAFTRGRDAYTITVSLDPTVAAAVGAPTSSTFNYSTSKTHTGWVVGAGVEWAFAQNWSLALEYDFYNFEDQLPLISKTAFSMINPKETQHVLTTAMSYRF